MTNENIAATEANAHIAASCRQVLAWIDAGCDPSTKSLKQLAKAIAEAEGRTI